MIGISYIAKLRTDNKIQVIPQNSWEMSLGGDEFNSNDSELIKEVSDLFDPEDNVDTDIVETIEDFKKRGADIKWILKEGKFITVDKL